MLDPASAIGLAASVVQIIGFTKNILNKSHELRTSAKGVLVQNAEIETAAASFGKLINPEYELDHSWHIHATSRGLNRMRNVPQSLKTFHLAIMRRLDWLVAARIDQNPKLLREPVEGRPLLDFCALSQEWDLVKILLAKGADLSSSGAESFAWRVLLETAVKMDAPSPQLKVVAQTIGLFLDHGADITVEITGKRIKYIIHHALTNWPARRTNKNKNCYRLNGKIRRGS